MSVHKEMESALNTALIGAFPTTQIFFENQDGNDEATVPFMVCNFLPATPEILEPHYNGKQRYPAVYQVTISTEKGKGKYTAYTMLDTLQTVLYRGAYLTSGGVITRIQTVHPESGRDEIGLFEIPVTVTCFATYP